MTHETMPTDVEELTANAINLRCTVSRNLRIFIKRQRQFVDMSTRHIHVGSDEALAAPEVRNSLHDARHELIAFTRDSYARRLLYLPFIRLIENLARKCSLYACLGTMASPVRDNKPDGIFPLEGFSLWLCSQLPGKDRLPIGCAQLFTTPAMTGVAL